MALNIVAQRFRILREKAKLSQYKLVEAVGGIKQAVYARYELGSCTPPYTVIVKLADFYDVSADYILGRTENPHGKYYGKGALSKEMQIDDFIEMCFEPNTNANEKLKQALKKIMEEQ